MKLLVDRRLPQRRRRHNVGDRGVRGADNETGYAARRIGVSPSSRPIRRVFNRFNDVILRI
jgi:hypothetical protein